MAAAYAWAMDDKVNLSEKLALLSGPYQPGVVGYLNDYKLQVVKVRAQFVWHKHDDTDDFVSLSGRPTITCATARSSSGGESCSWSRAASSTARRPTRRPTSS